MNTKKKPQTSGWPWKLYIFFILIFLIRKGQMIVDDSSNEFLYYHLLCGLDPSFLIQYFFHLGQIFLNLLHFIPLIYYAYRVRLFRAEVWQTLFVLKVFFDIMGHNYEIGYLVALFQFKPYVGTVATITAIMPYIPLYIACYRYAFRQDSLFK